jgi:hypothetical protein
MQTYCRRGNSHERVKLVAKLSQARGQGSRNCRHARNVRPRICHFPMQTLIRGRALPILRYLTLGGPEIMEKKIAGLIGAVATLGALSPAGAAPMASSAPTEILRANSFADLLEPIPNAVSLLRAVDEAGPSVDGNVQQAQYYYHHHHHHHHHAQFYPRYYPRYDYDDGAPVVIVRPPYGRYYHHHHHHHHHHSFYRRDYW